MGRSKPGGERFTGSEAPRRDNPTGFWHASSVSDPPIRKLEAEVRRKPDDPDLWEELARAALRRRLPDCLEILLEAARRHPGRSALVELARAELGLRYRCLGDPRLVHGAGVRALAFSPCGGKLASADDHGEVRFWSLATGLELRRVAAHHATVYGLDLSPDGTRMVTGSADRTARILDLGEPGRTLVLGGHRKPVLSVQFSPDGSRVLTGCADRVGRVFCSRSGRELVRMEGSLFGIRTLRFLPDGRQAVSGSMDRSLTIWDTRTGETLATLHGHRGWVRSLDLRRDGRLAVSTAEDETCRVWDLSSREEILRLPPRRGGATAACFLGRGESMAVAFKDGTVRVVETASGVERRRIAVHPGAVMGLATSPDGTWIATGGADGLVRVVDPGEGRDLHPRLGPEGRVVAGFLLSRGREAVAASASGGLHFYATEDGREVQTVRLPGMAAEAAALSRDERVLAVAGVDLDPDRSQGPRGTCRVWLADRPLADLRLDGHAGPVLSVAVSPDGSQVATGGEDRKVRLFDLAGSTGQEIASLPAGVVALAFDPHGRLLAAADASGRIRVLDLHPGRGSGGDDLSSEWMLPGAGRALAFLEVPRRGRSPSRVLLVVPAPEGGLALLDPRGGPVLERRDVGGASPILSLSARHGVLAVGTRKHGVHLLDAETLKSLGTIPCEGPVHCTDVSEESGLLLFGSEARMGLSSWKG